MSKELRGALHPRGWLLKVAVPIVSMIAVGIAVVVVVHANSGAGPQPANTASVGYPPADIASADFTTTAADAGRGLSDSINATATDGNLIVATGEQVGSRISRALFYYSTDAGGTWHLAAQQAALPAKSARTAQTTPPPDRAATLLTKGPNGWVAIGHNSIWTSQDGTTWTIVSSVGLPGAKNAAPVVLISNSTSYLAAARNGEIWVSHNGKTWWALKGAQGPTGVQFAAANSSTFLLASATNAWTSGYGTKWSPVKVPLTGGASNTIAGVAPLGNGFMAIRPEKVAFKALAYTSPTGRTWTKGTVFGTADRSGLTLGSVNGGTGGAVVTGVAHNNVVAFLTVDGTRWTGTAPLGSMNTLQVRAVSLVGGKIAVVAGRATTETGSQPLLTLAGATGHPRNITLAVPVTHQLSLNAITASATTQVAVGSADGYPATWATHDGGTTWQRGTGSALVTKNVRQLLAVAHGAAGWVAVGGVPLNSVSEMATATPVVVTSPDGTAWTSAGREPAFAGRGLNATGVAAGPSGYVITGQRGSTAVAWYSTGLTGWHAVTLPDAAGSQITAITAGRSYVAVGATGTQPAIWLSHNGSAWSHTVLPLPKGLVRCRLRYVAANGNQIVAIGLGTTPAGDGWPFAAESSDGGATWKQSALPVSWAQSWATALSASGSGFTVAGVAGTGPGDLNVAIWTLRNGSWTVATPTGRGLQGPGVQEITALTQAGNTLTGVGFIATPTSEVPTFWQSPVRG